MRGFRLEICKQSLKLFHKLLSIYIAFLASHQRELLIEIADQLHCYHTNGGLVTPLLQCPISD